MTREGFHQQLERMELELLEMGELAGTAVRRAVEAIVQQDPAKSEAVITEDDPIDHLYLRIDSGLLELLALQAPVASDLRMVSAILHSCLHLERIGDQAVNIAKIQLVTKDLPTSASMVQQIDEMGTLVVRMLLTVMESFAKKDVDLALQLPSLDDPVDRLNRATHLEALKLADDTRALDWGMHMNQVARNLERVGDNAVDIAEQVAFLVTGEFREFTDASHPVESGT
jgi:phosphate transport system protein